MKKAKIFLCVLCVVLVFTAFSVMASDLNTADADAIYAYVDENGKVIQSNMKVHMGDSGLDVLAVRGGKKGWLFDVVSAKTDYYLYMDTDDKYADKFDKGRIVEIEVEFFDAGEGSFAIEYIGRDGKAKESPYKEMDGSLSWKKHTFVITDALMNNGFEGADFKLSSKTKNMQTSFENFVVRAVNVNVTGMHDQVTITADTGIYGNHFFTGEDIKFNITLDNKTYIVESHKKGTYTLNGHFSVKSYEGDEVFTSDTTVQLEPGKPTKIELPLDVGGRYGVYFLTSTFTNEELGIRSEDTTRFSYTRTDFGETMNYVYGACTGKRLEFVPLLRNAGIGRIRIMNALNAVRYSDAGEKEAYLFPASSFEMQRLARENNINIFGNYLAVSGEFLPGEHAPHTDKGMESFFTYAHYMTDIERYGVDSYDMWNEWNLLGASFNRYARPLTDYIEFMKKTYTEMKAHYPEIKFWGGVTSNVDLTWLETILKSGGGEYMDGYCVHAYKTIAQDPMSSEAVTLVTRAREILDKYGYEDMPIVTTELGYVDDTFYGVDELRQGYYLMQYYVALSKIPHFDEYTQYQFQDGGIVKGSRENHWGLIEFSGAKTVGAAKASYPMIANMNHMLAGYKYAEDITINDDTYAYRMHNKNKIDDVIFLWARGNGGTVAIDLGVDSVELYDCYGNMTILHGVDGVYTFALSEAPIYVKGNFKKFERSEKQLISKNDFDIAFAQDATFTVNNFAGKKLNVELVPEKNDDLKFNVTENADGTMTVFVDTARTTSYRDRVGIKITDGENKYLDGILIFEYNTPIEMSLVCKPIQNADGGYELSNANLNITLSNTGSGVVSGKFLINDLVGATNYQKEYDNLCIEPSSSFTTVVNVSPDTSLFDVVATFITEDGIMIDLSDSTSYAVCQYAYNKPALDGVISDGEYGKPVYIGPNTAVTYTVVDFYQNDPNDFSANISYSWDEENLYIAMECIDNTLFNNSPEVASMWRYDSMQFAAAYDPEEKYDPSQMVSVLYGTTNGEQKLEMVVDQALCKMSDPQSGFDGTMKRHEKTTVFEVKVPWKTILMEERDVLPDTILKFAAVANDNDGGGRKAALQYGEGITAGSKSTDMFIKMYLAKEGDK